MKATQRNLPAYYFYLIAAFIVTTDQITKLLAEQFLVYRHSVSLIETYDFLRLTFITNTGAAWGLLRGYYILLVSIAILVSLGCVWIIQTTKQPLLRLSASLILGGGFGNMLDRLFHPHGVVDFVDVGIYGYRWPAFNVADTMLVIGMAVYLYKILRDDSLFLDRTTSSQEKEND
jgi:signal peptidase II